MAPSTATAQPQVINLQEKFTKFAKTFTPH